MLNHNLYFLQFAPKPSKKEPAGKLGEAIKRDFGSFENFKKEFNAAAVGLFGSGWAWLSVDKNGKLHITKEGNGSNPVRAGLNHFWVLMCGNTPTTWTTRTAAPTT